jgi:2,4-dienoyl-CoA reductase [(3E)-enoyl-CoA-producing], peroxisomal
MSLFIQISLMTSVFTPNCLQGKLALISGGATGICYGIAKSFLLHGASVYIISRKIDNINKAVKSLAEETGNKNIWGSSCDVRDEKQIEQTVRVVVETHGEIDILINGAAGNFLCPFEKLSPNAFKTVLMIDTVGTFLLSKYTVQYAMKKGGVILNITANLHHNGTILQSHAGTAKAGVDALTKHLAVELGPRNIRVVGVSPGAIENTEGFERLSTA